MRTLPTSHIASLVDRLVPILHLDFIQMLPSELSLQILSYLPLRALLSASLASRTWRRFALEPRLWRDLYKDVGWEENIAEIRLFEAQMRERADEEARQQQQAKRKAEEQRDEEKQMRDHARRNMDRFRTSIPQHVEGSDISGGPMDTSGEWPTQGSAPAQMPDSSGLNSESESQQTLRGSTSPGNPFGPTATASGLDDIYPSSLSRPVVLPTYQEASLPIRPTLTTPGYNNHRRLNWAFLYKNRKILEDNWLHNRYTTFQIPHPNYPHEGHGECIYTIQYSPNFLVSGSRDRTVRIWNMKTRRLVGEPLKGHNGSVLCLQFDESPDEDILITGSSDSSVIIWQFSTGKIVKIIEKAHQESVLNLKFSKKWLVTCSKDKFIKVWNREHLETTNKDYPWHSKYLFGNGVEARQHPHHPINIGQDQPTRTIQDPSTASGFELQNPFAYSAGRGFRAPPRTAKAIPAYSTVQNLVGHGAAVNAIQLHGDLIASASGDRLIKLWNLRTGLCEKTFMGHSKGIACIQYDGRTIVSGSSDQTIRVFDADTQAELATLQGHGALVRTVQATKNRIVSGSYDESVRIWRKDNEDCWVPGPVLRQTPSPLSHRTAAAAGAGHPANAGVQLNTLNYVPPAVQMHQVQHVGGAGFAGAVAAAQLLPAHHHQFQPTVLPQAGAAVPGGAPAPAPQTGHGSGTHRVFKLQFDARWIICCSQDSKIIGWDYAAEEEGVAEAARFFKSSM